MKSNSEDRTNNTSSPDNDKDPSGIPCIKLL